MVQKIIERLDLQVQEQLQAEFILAKELQEDMEENRLLLKVC